MSSLRDAVERLRERFEESLEELLADDESLVEVVVELDIPGSTRRRAYVGGEKLRFNGTTARTRVEPGIYRLIWDVQGTPNGEYRIAISAPAEAKWEPDPKKRLDTDGSDGGTHKFSVEAAEAGGET
jgi:hypothetical protein